MDQNQEEIIAFALIYSRFSTNIYPHIIILFINQTNILFNEVLKKYIYIFPLFIVEKKTEAVVLVPYLKTMVKWAPVLIYGRFYITAYSQENIIFESKTRMLLNEVMKKYLRIPLFPGQ